MSQESKKIAKDDMRPEYDFSDGVRGKYYEAYQLSSKAQTVTLQQALDTVEQLPFDQQEMLLEILKRRHIEIRREAIAAEAEQARIDFHAGLLKPLSADEAIAELREFLNEPEEGPLLNN